MKPGRGNGALGMTLVEVMVAVGIGAVVLTVAMTLFLFGLRSFAGVGNSMELSSQSRAALDRLGREIRAASQVIDAQTNLPVRWLTLSNAVEGSVTVFSWDSSTGVLTCDKTGQPTRTNLTGCDDWSFSLFRRSPGDDWSFYPATDLASCKQVRLSWKCSRLTMGKKLNTDESVSAQVVLRNKP